MQISSLKITGFKSFADPVELSFKALEIAAVVGPNGCGKSNIVDAIRWVLGEQSPKHLRGESMADVIFAGSDFRKPSGRAEVTLTFNNLKGPSLEKYGEFTELAVTRRLYRSGESAYLINKTPVRLMDIRDLFMDTGIGGTGYSIVEQGKVGALVTARPAERRHLIEEAAGIVKFRVKRQNAEKRMETTRQNLLRVQDVLEELQQREVELQGQVETAHHYTTLRQEVFRRDRELSVQRWGESKQQEQHASESLELQEKEQKLLKHQSTLLETELEKIILEQAQQNARSEEEQNSLFQKERLIQDADNKRKIAEQNCQNLQEQLQRNLQEQEEYKERFKELQNTQSESQEGLKALKARTLDVQTAVSKIQENRDEEESVLFDLDSKAQECQSSLLKTHTDLTTHTNNQHFLEERIEGISERFERISSQVAHNEEALTTLVSQKEESQHHVSSIMRKQEEIVLEIQSLQSQQKSHQQTLHTHTSKLQKAQYQLNTHASRLESLQQIQERHEDFGDSVKKFLKVLQKHPQAEKQLGILGVLADHISIAEEYLAKLGPFISEMLEWIVVQSPESIQQIEDFCHKHHLGGLSFVPLANIWDLHAPDVEPLASVQSLEPFVELEPQLEEWGKRFFGRIFLIPETDISWDVLPQTAQNNGIEEWISPLNTHITVHRAKIPLKTNSASSGYLQRKNEIQKLKTQIEEQKVQIQSLQEQQEIMLKEQKHWEEELRNLGAKKHKLDLELLHQKKENEQCQREHRRTQQQLKQLQEDLLRSQKEKETLKKRLQTTLEKLESLGLLQAELEVQLEEEREKVQEQRAVVEELSEQLFSQKITLTELSEQYKSKEATSQRLHKENQELEKKLEQHLSFQESAQTQLEEKMTTIQGINESYEDLLTQRKKVQTGLEKARQQQEELLQQQQQHTQKNQETRKSLEQKTAEVHKIQLKLSESQMKLKQIAEEFAEGLKLREERGEMSEADTELSNAINPLALLSQSMDWESFNAPQLRQELKKLRRQLSKMTHVNLGAPEEYNTLQERIESISIQVQDLQKALDDLQKMIRDINTESRRRFKKSFTQINMRFQELFTTLFEGGKARMILTDSDDVLEAGIDILAQPPGKQLQTLNLLSGGEKALTAISLIFSTFLIKPTPFCLLDEVDAPLDDANVARLNHLLQKLIKYSQFIIVTHNKKTMEIAKTLYGITMEESGVSKSISVEFE